MFQWSNKNKCKAKKLHKSDSNDSCNKISDKLLLEESELKLENQSDLIETKLKTSLQPSKETSPSLDDNVTTTDGYSKDTGISLEVIEFVKTALEIFFTNCYISCDLMEICDRPDLKITPTENRKHLIVHNTQQNNCKIYQCLDKHAAGIIFIFLTFEEINCERKYFITSPCLYGGMFVIPCESVEITEALIETPLSVAKLLCRIQTKEIVKKPEGLTSGAFTWVITRTEESFKVGHGIRRRDVCWSARMDDDESDPILSMDYIIQRNSTSFDFRIIRELTPKQFKIISNGLDTILTDFKVYLYNSNVQEGILRSENTILKTAVLALEKNPSYKLAPSNMGMDYGVFPTNYNTFICINGEDTSVVKFLFQWYTSGRYYVTSPFHPKGMTVSSRIPCAFPVDITDALKCGDIVDPLSCLTTREGEHVIPSNVFNWYMHESEGSFVVSSHKMGTIDNLYWTICEGEENIQLGDQDPSKFRIKLIDLA